MIARVAVAGSNELGESAFWSMATQQIYWLDGVAAAIHSWDPVTRQHRAIDALRRPVGAIVETTDPKVLAVTDPQGIALFNIDTRTELHLADPEHERAGINYNDAKVDVHGRLWVGTADTSEVEPRGCLWLLESGRPPRLADSGMAVVNGPAFSPDGRLMYVSDSVGRRILAYEVGSDRLKARRILVECTAEEGLPDGLTTDVEGCVWCAHWDGGRVTRFSPCGERLAVIHLPVPRVTSVAFGGRDLSTLFMTSARYGLSAGELADAPDAGSLFSASPGIAGVAATPLSLPFNCR